MGTGNTGLTWGYTLPITGGSAVTTLNEPYSQTYVNPWTGTIPGTAVSGFDVGYSETGNLAATTKTFTLSALPGINGGTAKVIGHLKEAALWNKAALGSGFNLTLTPGGTNPCNLLTGASGSIVIPPQGIYIFTGPDVTGLGAVVASTSDKVKIDAGANTVPYEIQFKGIST